MCSPNRKGERAETWSACSSRGGNEKSKRSPQSAHRWRYSDHGREMTHNS